MGLASTVYHCSFLSFGFFWDGYRLHILIYTCYLHVCLLEPDGKESEARRGQRSNKRVIKELPASLSECCLG